jgi:hypothetical protein
MQKIMLDPEAFNSELLLIVNDGKVGWPGEDHQRLLEALLPHLKDGDGNPVELTETQIDRFRLICRRTEAVQRRVLRDTLAESDMELDTETQETFELLFDSAQFAEFLSKSKRAGTDTGLIIKKKRRGAKRGKFNALMAASVTKPAKQSQEESETPEEEAEQETPPPPPKPAAAKPTTTKPVTKK